MAEHKVFISYSYADKDSRRLAAVLRRHLSDTGASIWTDSDIVQPGENWAERIERRLDEAKTFIVLLTPKSLQSPWINFELGVAAGRSKESGDVHLIPVFLKGAEKKEFPKFLRDRMVITAKKGSDELTAQEVTRAVEAILQ